MCGIFGCAGIESPVIKINEQDLSERLNRRGPDGFGSYNDEYANLFHSRLSIIDLKGGRQPIFNEENTKCIVFNGEIFNYSDLRTQLISLGHLFTTQSDTEVILHSYEQWGEQCIDKFRGMFAFAIWDKDKRNLFIARDRFGIKPLFYMIVDNVLWFASEIKALLQFNLIEKQIETNALASYFILSYIPAPQTIYKNIFKLPAGHTITLKNGTVAINKYWDLEFNPDHGRSEAFFTERLMELLEESVGLRMVSDVPVGAFLSGGIDSGTIVALMRKLSRSEINTFCMGFGGNVGGYLDERKYARLVAEQYGTNHYEHEVQPDIKSIIKELVSAFDEPFADHSTIPSYYLYKVTAEKVKVALSGLGGDELFGGYERYLGFKLSNIYQIIPSGIRNQIFKRIVGLFSESKSSSNTVDHIKRFIRYSSLPQHKRYFGYLSTNNVASNMFSVLADYNKGYEYCENLITQFFTNNDIKDPLNKVFYTDIKTYLPDDILACNDRMSMWHSLEARVPFLDHKLVEFSATIPPEYKIKYFEKKHILKKVARPMLSEEILNHKKQGFVGPLASWMRYDLRGYVYSKLIEEGMEKTGLFNVKIISDIVNNHFNYKENNEKLIWSLLIFQEWFDQYIDR